MTRTPPFRKTVAHRLSGEPDKGKKQPDLKPLEFPKPKRLFLSVALSPNPACKAAGKIAGKVIQHLTVLPGAKVTVTLEAHADVPGRAPDNPVRTATENARTLKFDTHSFEKE